MQLAQTLQGNTVTFTIGGNLDATTCLDVREQFEAALATNPEIVVVDLSELRLIDSSGIGAIVSLFKRIRAAGGAFEIRNVTGQPLSIFRVLRLDKVLRVSEPSGARLAAPSRAPSSPPASADESGSHAPQTETA